MLFLTLNRSIEARVEAMVAPAAASNALKTALNSKVSVQQLSVIDSEVVSVVNSMVVSSNNALNTELNKKLNASSTCQCFDPVALQNVNTSLSNLRQQSAFFVDTRSLSSIDNEVVSVVNNMVATSNNALNTELNKKLNFSSTCQCFDPLALQNVNTSLSNLRQQSAFFVDTRSLSSIDNEVVSVVNNMVSSSNNALNTELNKKLNFSSTCQCFNPASLQNVNATVTNLTQQAALFADARALQAMNASLANLTQQSAFFVDTRSLSSIDNEVVAVVNTMVASSNNALNTELNKKLNFSSTCQCFNPVLLQNVNTTLNNLTQQSAYFVDTRALGSITPQVVSVVSQMATAPPANNSLATQLSTKLTSAPACQCFDPVTLTSLNTSVMSVVAAQATLSSQVYVDTRNLSVLDTYVRNIVASSVQCNSLPAAVPKGSVATCFGTFNGFTCAPVCDPGYRLSGNYSCAAGTWFGSAQCIGELCKFLL